MNKKNMLFRPEKKIVHHLNFLKNLYWKKNDNLFEFNNIENVGVFFLSWIRYWIRYLHNSELICLK
jgi:hypothetical protein